jgi:predicted nucleotidyltransferase/predicted transcriptional regulator with HTH domain
MYYMLNFRSKLRQSLLAYYFTNPTQSHHVRELARMLAVDPTNLSRELAALETQGLFRSETQGRQKYYTFNKSYPLYEEMRSIIFKTVGVVGKLQATLENIEGLKEAYLYGSFARNQEDAASDIDVLLVGNPDQERLEESFRKLEKQFRREINYTLFTPQEFKKRRSRKDPFIADVLRQKKINLLPSA